MNIALDTLLTMWADLIWNLIRLGGFFMVVPIFGNQLVPARVRLSLALVTALALTSVIGGAPPLNEFDGGYVVEVFVQLLYGLGLGFATIVFFQLFVVAGQFIGMQMGLGFAAMVDPGNGVQVTVWSQFFLMLVTLSFLALNGHLVLLELLVNGFRLGYGMHELGVADFSYRIALMGGWMFVGGVLLAIPAVISLLIVNIAFGVMNRSAPQLNVFSLGFPFSLLFGLVIIWFLLHGWTDQFHRFIEEFFELTVSLLPVSELTAK